MRPHLLSPLALITAVAVSACGNASPSGPLLGAECSNRQWMGQFLGSATGAVTDTLAGCAYWQTVSGPPRGTSGNTSTFMMELSNGPLGAYRHTIGLFRWSGRLFPGTYTVGDPSTGGLYGQILVAQGNRTFTITGGTVIVTLAPENIIGSLTLMAIESGTAATISITGEFIAKCIDPGAVRLPSDDGVDETRPNPCGPISSG